MKTIFEIPTLGDDMTQPGGIALRYHEGKGEFVVHYFNTDAETGTKREYFQGGYYSAGSPQNAFMNALTDFTRRAERASGYDRGGAIDTANLGTPKAIRDTLAAGLERRDEVFFDNDEAFGDYTDDDREAFRKEQYAAECWLDRQ